MGIGLDWAASSRAGGGATGPRFVIVPESGPNPALVRGCRSCVELRRAAMDGAPGLESCPRGGTSWAPKFAGLMLLLSTELGSLED